MQVAKASATDEVHAGLFAFGAVNSSVSDAKVGVVLTLTVREPLELVIAKVPLECSGVFMKRW